MEILWGIVGVVCSVLLGLSFAITLAGSGMTRGEFLGARLCLYASAVLLGAAEMYTAMVTERPFWFRAASGAAVGLLLFVGLPEILRWVNKRQELAAPHESSALVRQLNESLSQIEQLKRELAVARQSKPSELPQPQASAPATMSTGPFTWSQMLDFSQTGDNAGIIFLSLGFEGRNATTADHAIQAAYAVSGMTDAERPWWHGTVCPTGRLRFKENGESGMILQEMVTDTGGMRRRWVTIPVVTAGASDDA